MTMKMDALQPEAITVNPTEASHEMEEKGDCGPGSPDGVDGLSPMPMPTDAEDESDESESDESGSESEEEEEEEEAMPDGDTNDDLHALLQFSKSRLEKTPQPPPPAEPTPAQAEGEGEEDGEEEEDDADATSDNENSADVVGVGNASEGDINTNDKSTVDEHPAINAHSEEKKTDVDVADPSAAPTQIKDQAYYIELAMKKANKAAQKAEQSEDESYLLKLAEQKTREAELKAKQDEDESYLLRLAEQKTKEAEIKAMQDEDPEYLRKVAERNVKEALAKSKEDEGTAAEGAARRRSAAKPRRDENAELWALLNYSQRRLETGATPQVKKRSSVVKGDDMSVSSKLSKSSKRSLNSKNSKSSAKKAAPVAVVGGPGDVASEGVPGDATQPKGPPETDAPVPDVTGNDEDSVDGSVSSESGAKASDESENSDDDDDESSDEESDEEEDELPDFLNDFGEDPEEAKMLYEAAKFKAASILSVSEDKLTDVQMLQAIAIAEDAARKGEDKFSTKRSLFKLNEAKMDDLRSFLSLNISSQKSQQKKSVAKKEEVAWGIGGGRFLKKIGAVCRDFKERCDEIDSNMAQERAEKPSGAEMVQAGMQDLKAQIEEYEKIVIATKKKGKEAVSRSLSRN